MSDPNRASYAPERPLAFDDYRQPRRGGPAPVTLILSLLVLMAAGAGSSSSIAAVFARPAARLSRSARR